MIEAHVDVKTTDGFLLRVFSIGFTKKPVGQVKRKCYAKSAKVRAIRTKMVRIMTREIVKANLRDVVNKL